MDGFEELVEGSAAEAAEWTEMGEWQVGGWAGMRGECGFELDRGRGSDKPVAVVSRENYRYGYEEKGNADKHLIQSINKRPC